uniref:eRF1 domain-containing protein n=1 Tax=Callorhinchus milii TaxID=7868 RepID=A0A4W3GCE5_CALMI
VSVSPSLSHLSLSHVLPRPLSLSLSAVVKCVLVASPGFVRDQFSDYLFQQAVKLDIKLLLENRSKFLLVHSSSGHKYALKEVLLDPVVTGRLADTKVRERERPRENALEIITYYVESPRSSGVRPLAS